MKLIPHSQPHHTSLESNLAVVVMRGPDGVLANCSCVVGNEEGAIGLSGAPVCWNCCANNGVSRFLVEMRMTYMSFTGVCVSKVILV